MSRGVVLVLGFLLSASSLPAAAQETTTGSIAGQVVDAQGLPIPGATVTVTSTQGAQKFVTDPQGQFLAPFLTPSTYTVKVELQGFAPVEVPSVVVTLGQRTVVPKVSLRVGNLTEQVQVVGAPPAVDTTSSGLGAVINSDLLSRLPVSRQLSDTLYLAPGVTESGGAGRSNPSISGASGLDNNYIIDGVNVTDTGYGALGSYSIIFGSLGTGVPFDFIREVQVKSGGYDAEFGQATGGVMNAITKSGSNDLRGTAFGYWRPQALEGTYTPVVLPNATRTSQAVNTTATNTSDVGVELGGPIWRDRLFFFAAYDPQWQETKLIAPEDYPLRALGDVSRDRRLQVYSAKGTYTFSPGHRVEVSVFGDPSRGDLGPQRRTALLRQTPTGFSSLEFGGHNQTARYEGAFGQHWLITAAVSHASNYLRESPETNLYSVLDTTVTPNARSGGLGYVENNEGGNTQYQAKATYLQSGHEIRAGVLLEDISYNNLINRTGPTFTLPNGAVTSTGAEITVFPDPAFGQIFRVTRANLTNVRMTSQQYLSFFVQDSWRLGSRLTVKPGVRYEQQKLIGNITDFSWTNNWAPRIGVIWDPTGTGRMRVFGNYARYFSKIPNDLAARALSADAGVTRADYFDAGLTRPVPAGTIAAGTATHFITAGLSAADFDTNAGTTYSDEWLIGSEYELASRLTVGANYVHRQFGRVLEDVGTAPMVAYFLNASQVGNSVEYFITNPGPDTQTSFPQYSASFEKPIHDYDAVTLTAGKRFGQNDRWGLQSSYQWSRLRGTFEGFYRNDNDQSDPAITSLFDFPTNDPSYTAIGVTQLGFRGDIRFLGKAGEGPLPLDRTHVVKVFGNYVFDFGLNVGLGMTVNSGTPLTALAANPVYESDGEIPETPRGGGIDTTSGFRKRTPWQDSLDVHADYGFAMGANRRLIVMADVFNLFNRQGVTNYDNYTEVAPTVLNPDFGRIMSYQTPRQMRVGLRFSF